MSNYDFDDVDEIEPIEDGSDFDELEPEDKSFEAVKKRENCNNVNAAYAKFEAGSANLDDLLAAVTKFTRSKIHGRLRDSPGGVSNVDDLAQDATMYAWEHLSDFNGGPQSFAPWLNRICYCKATDEFKAGKASRDKFEDLTVTNEDGDVDDNPAMYKEQKQEYVRKLPDWIQGTDLWICKLIRSGRTYAQIAKFCHISEPAVRQRVNKMRAKNLEDNKVANSVKKVRVKGKWIPAVSQKDVAE